MEQPTNGQDFELSLLTKKTNKMETKKTTLYQIENDYQSLMNDIEEADGELTEEQITALAINESELKQKTVGYLEVIRSKEGFNLTVDAEIKRLQAIKKRNNTLIDRLNNSLLDAVKLFGDITCGTLTFTTRRSEKTIIEDEELIDQKFKNQKITISVDKTAIKKAIKSGEEVPGAVIEENFNLKVK